MATSEPNRRAKSTSFDDWPPRHRSAWDQAIDNISLFQERKTSVSWKPQTIINYCKVYTRWLKWNKLKGIKINDTRPEDLMHRKAIEAYIADIKKTNNDRSCYNQLSSLYNIMRIIAPDQDWTWLNNAGKFYRKIAEASKEIKRLDQDSNDLINLGLSLMTQAADETTKNKRHRSGISRRKLALKYRDGLMIALLASRQFRIQNFTDLELGKSIQIYETTASLFLDGDETKEGNIIECIFPVSLFDNLQSYIATHRRILLEKAANPDKVMALWVSEAGGPLVERSLYGAIKKRTRQAFGYTVSPHKFRHAAATTLIEHAPQSAQLASTLLGHKRGDIVEKHYNQANPELGVARYAAELAKVRGK